MYLCTQKKQPLGGLQSKYLDMNTEKMNVFGLLRNLWPFVKPYRLLIVATVTLTFIGSLMAQVNAVVLDKPSMPSMP